MELWDFMSLVDTHAGARTHTFDYIHIHMPFITVNWPINLLQSAIYIKSHTLTYDYALARRAAYEADSWTRALSNRLRVAHTRAETHTVLVGQTNWLSS